MSCNCDKQIDDLCPICCTVKGQKKMFCGTHDKIMICGPCLKACDDCKNKGLRYMSGYGGAPYIHDLIDNKKYFLEDLEKPFIKHFQRPVVCRCDNTTSIECIFCRKQLGTKKEYCPSHDPENEAYVASVCPDKCEFYFIANN